MFGTSLKQKDLFANETPIATKNANAIIMLTDYGKDKVNGKVDAAKIIGFHRSEAIGGQLHLTNYRLIFKSHWINRLRGKFSIFLNTIQDVRDASQMLAKKIQVSALSQSYEFVIWGIPQFLQTLDDARKNMSTEQMLALKPEIESNIEKVGTGLDYSKGVDLALRGVLNIENIALNPLSLSSYIDIAEIFGDVSKKEK